MATQPTYRLEAEDLTVRRGFSIEHDQNVGASGDAYLTLGSNRSGAARGEFQGDDGVYEIRLGYFDEADGDARAYFRFDNQVFREQFNRDTGGKDVSSETHTEVVLHDSMELETGDSILFVLRTYGMEAGSIDYIDFHRIDTPQEPDVPDRPQNPAPPDDTSGNNPPPPPPADNPPPSDSFGAFEQEVVRLTNEIRANHGLNPLIVNDDLNDAAEGHSADMGQLDFFSHRSKDGSSAGDRIKDEGYDWWTYGENIAAGYDTPAQVVNAWYASSGHRANMLDPSFEDIGVGFVEQSPDTGSVNYTEYWTQVFAA